MKMLSIVLAFVVLMAGSAFAQLSCDTPNMMALAFDTDATQNNIDGVAPFSMVQASLYLLNPEAPCVRGFELSLDLSPNLILLSTEFPGDALNVATSPQFIVGFSYGHVPEDGKLLLATFNIMYTDSDGGPAHVFLGPSDPSSLPGQMAYLNCDEEIIAAPPLSGDFVTPVLQINGATPLVFCLQDTELDWSVDISCFEDTDNRVGTDSQATDGFDPAFDLADEADQPLVFFYRPQWEQPGNSAYRQDILASYDPLEETRSWTFTVNTMIPEGEDLPYAVALDFQPSFAEDPNIILSLIDQTSGQAVVLQPPYQYQYLVHGDEWRTFQLSVGHEFVTPVEAIVDVQIDVSCNGRTDFGNHALAHDEASDGFDLDLDLPEPGPSPSQYLVASFPQSGWPFGPRFRQVAHGPYDPVQEHKEWSFRVESDLVGTVTMDFSANFDENSNILLILRDEESGLVYNLFPELTYSYENEFPSLHNFTIIIGNQGPPDMNPTERYLREGWNLVSLPLVPEPGGDSAAELFFNRIDANAYLFEYLGYDGYEALGLGTPLVHGQGYWATLNMNDWWDAPGTMNLDAIDLSLNEGWNLIGYPLWFNGDVVNIRVRHDGQIHTWTEAVDASLVLNAVMGFNNAYDNYYSALTLGNYEGYWVAALSDGVELVFQWENFMEIPWSKSHPVRDETPATDLWKTTVTARLGHGPAHQVHFGVNPEASDAFDSRWDIPRIPASPEAVGSFGLLRPQYNLPTGPALFQDLVHPAAEKMEWTAELVVEQSSQVTLNWDRQDWPENLDLQIYHPGDNRVILDSMKSTNSLRLSVPSGYLQLQFRTPQLSAVEDTPEHLGQLQIHPNPFNPQTRISFALDKAGRAEVRIYSVRGEMVRTLVSERVEAGQHEVIWNGQDRAGRNVPSGSYFAKLVLNGEAVGQVSKMSLVR